MKIGYDLVIEQTQKLSMTPELIQSIHILQLNNQDLMEYVKTEVLENPVLESKSTLESSQAVDIKEKLRESIADSERFRQFEYSPDDDEEYTYEQYVSKEETLTDYLLTQLNFSNLKDDKAAIGTYIIEAIDDNGYLTMSTEELAEELGFDAEIIDEVIDVIQTFDPVGVCARNLRECLIIQLEAKGLLTKEIEYVITDMLEDLAENRIAVISKKIGMTPEQVQGLADLIKSLDPKPGRAFSTGQGTNYVIPDVFVEMVNGEYTVVTNNKSTPKLMLSSYYDKVVREAGDDEELKNYLNDKFNSAIWLIKSIEQRRNTIHSVASAIFSYQREFFEKGEKYLKPLTLKQIADELGIHESTVSRTINGKYIQSSQGVYELKHFFSSGLAMDDGTSVSSNSIKSMIRDIISEEDPKKPVSDQCIAEMLEAKEIHISRRTVAKYREGMGILSSSKRRRF